MCARTTLAFPNSFKAAAQKLPEILSFQSEIKSKLNAPPTRFYGIHSPGVHFGDRGERSEQ